MKVNRVAALWIVLSATAVVVLTLCVLCTGSVPLSVGDVWAALTGRVPQTPTIDADLAHFVVWETRLPEALVAILSGAALAVSGLIMQTLFRNPLADPSLLGVGAGAAVGAAVAILVFGGALFMAVGSTLCVVVAAMIGATLVVVLLTLVARRVNDNASLLIIGVMLSLFAGAIVTLLNYHAAADGVRQFVLWGMGDFSSVGLPLLPLYACCLLPPLLLLPCCAKGLDALLLGHDYAATLGVNVRRLRPLLLLVAGWLTAVTTALCGPIAFVGLAVPHLARALVGSGLHRVLLPLTMLLGSVVCLLCQLLCSASLLPFALPLNALTPLIGAPVVICLMLRGKAQA